MSEIDHDLTDEVVCPWCGQVSSDSWEYDDEGEEWCDQCEKDFTFVRNITVTYSTEKKKHSGGK